MPSGGSPGISPDVGAPDTVIDGAVSSDAAETVAFPQAVRVIINNAAAKSIETGFLMLRFLLCFIREEYNMRSLNET